MIPPLPDNLSNDDAFVYALRDLNTSEYVIFSSLIYLELMSPPESLLKHFDVFANGTIVRTAK